MALTTTTTLKASVRVVQSNPQDLASPAATTTLTYEDTLASGTGADQADRSYSDTFQIAASGTANLDLAGGLIGPLGEAVIFVELTSIMVKANASNTNDIIVGNGTAPVVGGPFGPTGTNAINVPPNSCFFWSTSKNPGVTVTATTADILKLANSAAGTVVDGEIVLTGRSA